MTESDLIATLLAPKDALFLGGALLAVSLVVLGTRRRVQNRDAQRADDRDRAAGDRHRAAARDDMQELMVQLEELSRRIGAQIDTRFAKLETVISDADDRIARLESAVRAARGVPTLDITVGDAEAPPGASGPVPSAASPAAAPTSRTSEPPKDTDPQRSRIHRLSDEGKTPVEIARLTGVKPGEVELILALREGAGGR